MLSGLSSLIEMFVCLFYSSRLLPALYLCIVDVKSKHINFVTEHINFVTMKDITVKATQLVIDAYTDYHSQVCRYIYYRIDNKEEAEDLTQDVYLRLMDYKEMLCEDTLRYFVFTIARNLVYDYLRRYYKRQEITSYLYDHAVVCSNETESQIIAKDMEACEQHKLSLLPRQRGTIYRMSRYDDKSIAEISDELCLSPRTVENHLFISRKEVREYMRQCI